MNPLLHRREFLARTAGAVILSQLPKSTAAATSPTEGRQPVTARQFLEGILYTKDEVRDWLDGKAFPIRSAAMPRCSTSPPPMG